MWTESVWCDFPEKKASKLHPIGQIWQCYLTNFLGWIISEFAVLTMAAATARAGLRTPMALYRYSFGLHLIWNRDFEPFGKDLWRKSQRKSSKPDLGQHILLFFSVKWQGTSQLDSMKQFCFDEFFRSKTATQRKSRYLGKTQQIVHRFRLFTIILVQLQQRHPFLTINDGSVPVFFWSSFDLKSRF